MCHMLINFKLYLIVQGEALGGSVKGLMEPLQAVGNKGNAGLGWDHSRR